MADKIIGYGTLVKLGSTAQGELRTVTPPPRAYERVDVSDLDSVVMVSAAGVESESEFSYIQLWEPGDSNQELVTTEFEDRATSAWSVVFPGVNNGDSTLTATETWTFNARVMNLEPAEITLSDVVTRTVTMLRVGDITRT